jgi:hypothetical protein
MLAPWSVVSRYLGSVSSDSTLCRCGRTSWSGRIYSKPCDAPPLVGNAQDCFRVVVGCMRQKWACGSKCFLSHPLDQTDITTTNPIHSKCVCGSGNHRDSDRGRVLVQSHQQGGPHLPGVARWLLFIPKCVPASKNTNTTRGTLLVLKTCMKLVVYPPRFRDLDGQKLVVKTVNKLPQAEHLLVLEQSLDLTLDKSCIGVTTLQVPMHNSILYLQFKRSVWEKLSHVLLVGLVTFHLAFRGWKVERFGLCITHPSLFRILSRSFEIFTKSDKVPRMVLSTAQVVLVSSPKAFERASTSYSIACMWSIG